jgi:hypothetical protein
MGDDKKSVTVGVSMWASERALLEEEAAKEGLSLSAWGRVALLTYIGVENVEPRKRGRKSGEKKEEVVTTE